MPSKTKIAIFSPEAAFHKDIPVYTGGLGYLMLTFARDGYKLGLPAVIVAPLSRYYRQTIINTPAGKQMGIEEDTSLHPEELLELTPVEFALPLGNSEIWTRVWYFPGQVHESLDVILLDTDYEKNPEALRLVTRYLYGGFSANNGGGDWRRITLAYILGVAGMKALDQLGYKISVHHLNESHAVFAAMELLRRQLEKKIDPKDAIENVRKHVLFTTHTPVPAGIWQVNLDRMVSVTDRYFQFGRSIYEQLGQKDNDFNFAVAALRLSGITNAVSDRHRITTERMFSWVKNPEGKEYPITHVTNGVWEGWQDYRYCDATSLAELKSAKRQCKGELLDYVRTTTGKYFSENVLTAVFARRWTGYKRPFLSLDKLETVGVGNLLRHNQIQLIFAGLPNPDEGEMVNTWNHVLDLSQKFPNIAILPGYDLRMSALLKAGADLWVFNPAANKEACGTSPASAMLNWTLVLSTPDGMMLEVDPQNHFIFGHNSERDWSRQWIDDAKSFRTALAGIVEQFYGEPEAWEEMASAARQEGLKDWTGVQRMIPGYQDLYRKLGAKI